MLLQVKDFGKGMTPINRAGQPAELAPSFVFLANNAGICHFLFIYACCQLLCKTRKTQEDDLGDILLYSCECNAAEDVMVPNAEQLAVDLCVLA